jgi:hypothetical protein
MLIADSIVNAFKSTILSSAISDNIPVTLATFLRFGSDPDFSFHSLQ